MKAISRRLQLLETRLTDATGLVRHSEPWFTYWADIVDRLVAGEEPAFRGRIPLEVVDWMVERADREEGLLT
jgi:hypothetical protein